jgi:hypothetical protein
MPPKKKRRPTTSILMALLPNNFIVPYRDIDDLLDFLARGVQNIFGGDLTGFYLTGSLSYGDFDSGRSDIDLAAVLEKLAQPDQIDKIEKLHQAAEQKFNQWAERIECSYVPRSMLTEILPPKEPRPYFGAGIFYSAAPYGNEWLINRHFLYQNGIALLGPDFKTLAASVAMADLRQACVRDLREEWVPKINDENFLNNSHCQSYVVLNLCRILYTVANGEAVSKKAAAEWAKSEYPQWKDLIETAESWRYGIEMECQNETIGFIKFAVGKAGSVG